MNYLKTLCLNHIRTRRETARRLLVRQSRQKTRDSTSSSSEAIDVGVSGPGSTSWVERHRSRNKFKRRMSLVADATLSAKMLLPSTGFTCARNENTRCRTCNPQDHPSSRWQPVAVRRIRPWRPSSAQGRLAALLHAALGFGNESA